MFVVSKNEERHYNSTYISYSSAYCVFGTFFCVMFPFVNIYDTVSFSGNILDCILELCLYSSSACMQISGFAFI